MVSTGGLWKINLVTVAFLCILYTPCNGKTLASYDDVISLIKVGDGGIKVNWIDTIKKSKC